jgi:hypothetical protein
VSKLVGQAVERRLITVVAELQEISITLLPNIEEVRAKVNESGDEKF